MSEKDNRTEQATTHKRLEERRKGRMFRNRELVAAAIFMFEIVYLKWNLGTGFSLFHDFFRRVLENPLPREFSISYVQDLGSSTGLLLATLLGPLLAMVLLFSLVGQLAQGGWNFALQALQFNPSKIAPKNNFGKIFSASGAFDLIKSVVMFALIAGLGWGALARLWPTLPGWAYMTPRETAGRALGVAYDMAWDMGLAYLIVVAAEYFVHRRQFTDSMKMTKQEIKDEMRQMEGNPQIKGKIRQLQIQFSRRRLTKDVAAATVVVTNPTHYAVALRYDANTMAAPEVVAKGRGWLALRIRTIAEEHNVPRVENRPLAQLLYKKVEVGETIPLELYRAVAEILAYLMRARDAFGA